MKQIEEAVKKAIQDCGFKVPKSIPVTRPDEKFGDYATSVAFEMANETVTNTRDVANKIISELQQMPEFEKVEVAGAGFINIRMSEGWLANQLETTEPVELFLKGKKYIIEYSSPNIAKPMHVGHLRTTVLGQVLTNLYRTLGAEVVAWSHPGDWGVQFGKLIVAWKKWGNEDALTQNPIDELLRVYVQFHKEAQVYPALDQEAKETFKALQNGDKEAQLLWERFSALSHKEFDRMYQLLGVKFDVWRGESAYNDRLLGLVDEAIKAGIAKESDGAIVIPSDQSNVPPILIRKSDGATLYATSDLVSVKERVDTYQPDEVIYVVGSEQTMHLKQVFEAAQKLTEAGLYGAHFALPRLTHVSYGFFRLAHGKMSTRQGDVIRLDDVLNEAIRQADEMLKQKSADLSQVEREKLAQEIGVGAVKYTDLIHDRHTDVVFDWDKMFSLEGNSIVYLMYTNARCNSLLRSSVMPAHSTVLRVGERGVESKDESSLVVDALIELKPESRRDGMTDKEGWTSQEKRLMLTLLELNDATQKSVRDYDPHHLLNHIYKVATDFSRFYNSNQILRVEDHIKARRLDLVKRVQAQLKMVFHLLHIEAPDKL